MTAKKDGGRKPNGMIDTLSIKKYRPDPKTINRALWGQDEPPKTVGQAPQPQPKK